MPRFTLFIDTDKAVDHPLTWRELTGEVRHVLDKIEDLHAGVELDHPVDRMVTFPINEYSGYFENRIGQYKVAPRPDERT